MNLTIVFQKKYIFINIFVLLTIIIACKKQKNQESNSELDSLDSNIINHNKKLYDSLSPGEFIITFDDGPILPYHTECEFTPSTTESGEIITTAVDDSISTSDEPIVEELVAEGEAEDKVLQKFQELELEKTKQPAKTADILKKNQRQNNIPKIYNSATLIDFLIQNDIPATLFIISLLYRNSPAAKCYLDKAIASDNIIVANHTWSHLSSFIKPKECNNSLPYDQLFVTDHNHESNIHDNSLNTNNQITTPTTKTPKNTQTFQSTDQINQTTEIDEKYAIITTEHDPHNPPTKHQDAIDDKSKKPSVSNPDGFSKFIRQEVMQAHCLLNERLENVLGSYDKAKKYPLFYRPPGGFWYKEDSKFLVKNEALKTYLGPVYWNFGGELNKTHAADFQCWKVAYDFNRGVTDKINEHKANLNEEFISDLTNPLVTAEQACANMYIKSIKLKPEKDQKGVILLHDNFEQSVKMFMEYLYPALIANGYKIVALDKTSFYQNLISELEYPETRPDFLNTPCKVPKNHCTCCSHYNKSCCNGAQPPPRE